MLAVPPAWKVRLSRLSRLVRPVLVLAALAAFPAAAGAATVTVDSTADENAATPPNGSCTLREAVLAANAGATVDGCVPVADGGPAITIVVPAGTYALTLAGSGEDAGATGDLDLAAEIVLQGAGRGSTVIDAGVLGDRVLEVHLGTVARIEDLTLQGGAAGLDLGGGVHNLGSLTLLRTTVRANSSSFAGGILNDGSLVIDRSTVSENVSGGGGGGLSNSAAADALVLASSFTLNRADRGGGIRNYGSLEIRDSMIVENQGTMDGGGIDTTSGTVTVIRSALSLNNTDTLQHAGGGGGLSLRGGQVSLVESLVADNYSDVAGGGVRVSGGAILQALDTAFLGNSVDGPGGGLTTNGTTTLERCLIAGNVSDSSGAGIRNLDGTLTLVNSTVSGNVLLETSTDNTAAGIANYAPLVLRHATLADNTIDDTDPDPGPFTELYTQFGSEVTIESSIVEGECGVFSGTAVSEGGNLESPGDTCTLTDPSDQVAVAAVDLDLQPLADNGGPTPTHALGAASVALGAAIQLDCPATDQRGFFRVDGDCDSGAFELGALAPEIFADGFESGDTSAWSATVP